MLTLRICVRNVYLRRIFRMSDVNQFGLSDSLLVETGMDHLSADDFFLKDIVLRDGRQALLWVHQPSGHGILHKDFWPTDNFYDENYRSEFSASAKGDYYNQLSHLEMYADLNKKQYQQIEKLLDEHSRYLEVGCSFGGVLRLVLQRPVAECVAIEPNVQDASFVKQELPGVKIINALLEKAELPEAYFDIVASYEVLEHAISPKYFLSKIHTLLKQGGSVNIEVPNHNDVIYKYYKGTGYQEFYYHKAHIHYFTSKSLMELAEHCGFIGKVSSFLMYPFFNHANWAMNKAPQKSADAALATPQPCDDSDSTAQTINAFYRRIEKEYEQLINQNMVGDCLVFQGKKE